MVSRWIDDKPDELCWHSGRKKKMVIASFQLIQAGHYSPNGLIYATYNNLLISIVIYLDYRV